MPMLGAVSDLGLGGVLRDQTADEIEEEKRRKRLGLAPIDKNSAAASLFGFGQTGVASVGSLGMSGGRRY